MSKGYLCKEEAKEFMGEYGDEIIETKNILGTRLKKLNEKSRRKMIRNLLRLLVRKHAKD